MANEISGGISPSERFTRLEVRVEQALREISVERHRITNLLQIEKLLTELVTSLKDHESRLRTIETKESTDKAVEAAFAAAKKEAKSNKRWVIGVGGGLLINFLMLLKVLAEI